MIILVNKNDKIVYLYNETGQVKIPFSDIYLIKNYMQDKSANYVTAATEVKAEDVINLICSQSNEQISATSKNNYLHSTIEGIMYIPDIDLKFEGKYDCKLYDKKIKNLIEESDLLKNLIKIGKIEIVNELQRRNLAQQAKSKQKDILFKQKQRDAALDQIIVDKPAQLVAEEGIINNNDTEELDILGILTPEELKTEKLMQGNIE